MSTFELNGKDFATQTSSAEPVIASTVTGGAGLSPSGHCKKITAYQPSISTADIIPSDGNTVIMTFDFTPLSTTTNLLITFYTTYQFYGNTASDDAAALTYFKHNGAVMQQHTHYNPHSNSSGLAAFHLTQNGTNAFYVAETHGSTTTGAARTILYSVTAENNRYSYGNNYGANSIFVMEF